MLVAMFLNRPVTTVRHERVQSTSNLYPFQTFKILYFKNIIIFPMTKCIYNHLTNISPCLCVRYTANGFAMKNEYYLVPT